MQDIALDASLTIEHKPDGTYFHFKGFSLYYACLILHLAGFKRAMEIYREEYPKL